MGIDRMDAACRNRPQILHVAAESKRPRHGEPDAMIVGLSGQAGALAGQARIAAAVMATRLSKVAPSLDCIDMP